MARLAVVINVHLQSHGAPMSWGSFGRDVKASVAAWKEGRGFWGGSPVPKHPISPLHQALAGAVAKPGKLPCLPVKRSADLEAWEPV